MLENAVVYDLETFPNCFCCAAEALNNDDRAVWEISEFKDDRISLLTWLHNLHKSQTPMIGFNNLGFDYIVLHFLINNPNATVEQLYQKAMQIITRQDKFGDMIWQSDRFIPQIDLFKINHFDNPAKSTSLKALEINRRSKHVSDMPVEVGTRLTRDQIDRLLIPYNFDDVRETKGFAHDCRDALNFRIGMLDTIRGDVMNFNDTKIGAKLLEQRIGEDICYDRSSGRKVPRQTVRSHIALRDIIFPYIRFNNPEFARVHNWMMQQVLTPDILTDPENTRIQTKGVFSGISANVGGIDFHFGTGGIHGSVPPQIVRAGNGWRIRDIDVGGYYPNAAIVNRLAPAHLGEAYSREYSKLPVERKEWQIKKGKKCVEANSLKLAGNGVYGNSNNPYSIFYDPQYTMAVTINCQLMLAMLAEWLSNVPTLRIIQANTDGITYYIHDDHEPQAAAICKQWETFTCLTLEDAEYSRMWIRDVNNYIAENTKGELKLKGAYWHPDPLRYAESISESQPPAWHKDLGNCISIRAANAAMIHGINPELFIRTHTDPFDFMLRAKVSRADKLMIGNQEIQRTSRYYVARNGAPLKRISPPVKGAKVGDYKRASKVSELLWVTVNNEIAPGTWDARIHTKNKSKHEMRESAFCAGYNVAECNDASAFNFDNIDYSFYVAEAEKLIIR